jgi:hypothetical protein
MAPVRESGASLGSIRNAAFNSRGASAELALRNVSPCATRLMTKASAIAMRAGMVVKRMLGGPVASGAIVERSRKSRGPPCR